MNMNRTGRIASTIEKRRPLTQKIESVEANLRSLATVLDKLEQQRNQLLTRVDDPNVAGLKEIDFSRILLSIVAELEALGKLKARFSRQNLNLGVVGIARQGKSRLLRSLTGLSAAEIPDGDKGHCTGVRSTIYHIADGVPYGMVWFHSEQSFLDDVIAPYYDKLGLGAKPMTIEEFSRTLPSLPSNLAKDPIYKAMYDYLGKYHENLAKYRQMLGASPLKISHNQIREYVAQDNLAGNRVYFNYLAVQKVSIFCTFPKTYGQIALVDMPGLGDTGVGAEERLIELLGQEVDAVLFVRLPKSTGDDWFPLDLNLYGTAKNALKDRLPINKWSFMILNRTDRSSGKGDNSEQCKFMASKLEQTPIDVVKPVIIANCADEEEASTKILDRVLDYLAANIESLDKEYASSCQEGLWRLQRAVSVELDKARNALEHKVPTAEEDETFEELFEELWEDLTGGLEALVAEFRGQSDDEDGYFQEQVKAAIALCKADTGIPSELKEIKKRRDSMGSYGKAYHQYLDEIRTHLTQHFLSLDVGLNRAIEQAKARVAQVLIEQGRLGDLTEARGADFIKVMAQQLPENQNKLKRGFQLLSSFELSFRGLIQHRIRKHLDNLTPDANAIPLSDSRNEEELQKEIQENLQILHAEAVDKCKIALESMLGEPTLAALVIVEEFVDQVLRAKGMLRQWRLFLKKEKSKVWSDKFAEQNEQSENRRVWLNLVERPAAANQLESMRFLD